MAAVPAGTPDKPHPTSKVHPESAD